MWNPSLFGILQTVTLKDFSIVLLKVYVALLRLCSNKNYVAFYVYATINPTSMLYEKYLGWLVANSLIVPHIVAYGTLWKMHIST